MKTSLWLAFNKAAPKKVVAPLKRIGVDRRVFSVDGKQWRWKGVTAFPLLNLFAKGENIDPILDVFDGFNLLRVFYYVDWPEIGWGIPSDEKTHGFLRYVASRGFYVELVLFPSPIANPQQMVDHFFAEFAEHENLVVELVNEPGVGPKVDSATLTIPQTPILWTDGITTALHRGDYLNPHTPRDDQWMRKAKNLREYWDGGGPETPQDPPFKEPAIVDEPIQPQRPEADKPDAIRAAGGNWDQVVKDYRAYFGIAAMMGGGGTFHFDNGKYGLLPTANDLRCAAAALEGLNAFPEDAPFGAYSRPEDSTLRTYIIGNYMVRVRPTSLEGVVPGTMLDKDGILWKL
jgi:hypothetical protein